MWLGAILGLATGFGGVLATLRKNPVWLLFWLALGLGVGIAVHAALTHLLSNPGPRCVGREPVAAFFDGRTVTLVFKNSAYGKLFARENPAS